MYLIAIAWFYVALLMALAEAARVELGDKRLQRIGTGVREPGRVE